MFLPLLLCFLLSATQVQAQVRCIDAPIGPCLLDQCPYGFTCVNPRSQNSKCCLKVMSDDATSPTPI